MWVGCTDPNCVGHNLYTPSSSFFNSSLVDGIYYGDGSESFQSWRVNDTLAFGALTIQTTFGAAFAIGVYAGVQDVDGNFGIAKSYWYGGKCSLYPNFIELAAINGQIKAPVISWYEVSDWAPVITLIVTDTIVDCQLSSTDNAAPGLTSVAQIGGVDRNKYTGSIDWVPMTPYSMWQSPSQTRTVRRTSGGAVIPTYFQHQIITFDTGDPYALWLPTDDFNIIVGAVGGFKDGSQNWFFPCGSTLTLNMNGSQGRNYVVALADPTQPYVWNSAYCAAIPYDAGATDNW